MKQTLSLIVIIAMVMALGCTKETTAGTDGTQGIVKGRVTDSRGNGMPGVQVVIEHTVLYAKYVYATTDAHGYYKTSVPEGSWRASVQIQKQFLDRTYNFELCPDVADAFAGSAGAVRNFTWKLSGAKPYGGYYGSYVAVYNEPGYALEMSDVEIKLTPDGPLVDGSMGSVISSKLSDIGGGEDGIRDVPIGMYVITAKNTATGQPLEIRMRNTGTYGSSVTGIFNSGFTGLNNYQIVVQVK